MAKPTRSGESPDRSKNEIRRARLAARSAKLSASKRELLETLHQFSGHLRVKRVRRLRTVQRDLQYEFCRGFQQQGFVRDAATRRHRDCANLQPAEFGQSPC